MNERHQKQGKDEILFSVINTVILILFSFICFYPIWFFIINSFSESREIAKGVFFWPRGWTLYNYSHLIEEVGDLKSAFIVSVARTILGTMLTAVACSYTAFLVCQKELPGRKIAYRFIVITMYINAGTIPWFLTMRAYGLSNNFLLYIVPSAISAFYVILLKTYFESIPAELQESAEIDGAGILTVFIRLMIPLSKPVLASVAVFAAVNQWNSWYDNFMLVTKDNLQTIQYLLYKYLTKNTAMTGNTAVSSMQTAKASPTSIRITITMVTMLPIIIVYPLLQKYFVKGIMLGAVKG